MPHDRIIAVEEHFSTPEYWERTADSAPFAGQEDELAWTRAARSDAAMARKLTDIETLPTVRSEFA